MLLQTDGSKHDWLEERGPELTLVGGIDDATGTVTGGRFRAAEDAAGYFEMLVQTIRRHGLPLALYTDLSGVFIKDPNRPPTLAEQLTGRRSLTQVGRALDVLGIRWIGARSPEAKGRVERLWGTLQDRLVSELRRARVTTLEGANELLAWYLPRHNRRFALEPADPAPAWRPWPSDLPPEAVLCFEYPRRAERDATVSWAAAASRCRDAAAGPAGPDAGSSSRSGSTAASGRATRATCTSSSPPRQRRRSCGRARSAGCPSSPPRPNHASRASIPRPRQPRHPGLVRTTPGAGTLPSGPSHGDRIAVALAVRVAVVRQLRMVMPGSDRRAGAGSGI